MYVWYGGTHAVAGTGHDSFSPTARMMPCRCKRKLSGNLFPHLLSSPFTVETKARGGHDENVESDKMGGGGGGGGHYWSVVVSWLFGVGVISRAHMR